LELKRAPLTHAAGFSDPPSALAFSALFPPHFPFPSVCVCCLDSRRHVWLPLDFCRDFLFGITPPCCCCCRLLTPSPIFTFPPGFHHFPLCDSRRLFCAQFFCSCLFFCSVLIFFLFVRWPKVNP